MKRLKAVSVCLSVTLAVCGLSCTNLSYAEEIPLPVTSEEEAALLAELQPYDDSKSDRFIVKYKENTDQSYKITAENTASLYSTEHTDNSSEVYSLESDSDIQVIELSEKTDIADFTEKIQSNPEVEYVQPDYKINLAADDDKQVTENNTAVDEITETQLIQETTERSGNIVAVIDTGIDINNPVIENGSFHNNEDKGNDEDGNGYINDICGWDFYNNSPVVYNQDLGLDQAHGTLIAGIIAAAAPESRILPLKVFENGTAYTSDIIEAIHYAEAMGANIANCSWGCTEDNRALYEAMAQSSMLFVCAAGNNRLDLTQTPVYPACYELDNVISVTSVNDDGGLSYFSNYGKADIAARGRDIEGIFPDGQTGILTGTSISAAFVSGASAAVYTNNAETIERLYTTADKLSNLQNYVDNGRRLNYEALLSNTVSTDIIDVNPEEDFNVEGYSRTPEASWELFGALDNISVAAGRYHLAVLKADGSVWTWGANNYGQLGVGSYTNSETPCQVPSLSDIVELRSGENHIVARKADGTVYAWGENRNGCLGNGTTANSNVPVKMTGCTNAIGIGAAAGVSYVIKAGNVLYACGANGWGQIGDGTRNTVRASLTKVSISENVSYVTGNGGTSFAITENGALYSWGHDGYGQLGDGGANEDRPTPQMIINSGVADVSMGFYTALIVKSDGTVYTCGYGTSSSPVKIAGLSGVSKAVSGRQAEFVMNGNTIKSKGMNTNGALGLGDTSWHSSWGTVSGSFKDFAVYEFRGIAIGTNGCIYTWGTQNTDTNTYVAAPQKMDSKINDLAADELENATLTEEGLTHGNFLTTEYHDYYKFKPDRPGIFSVYSCSDTDLVCKIYTKNNDGSFVLKYSNDDGHGKMSDNLYDFCLSAKMEAMTTYYIYVSIYTGCDTGEYELHIERESSTVEYTFSDDEGALRDVYINVNNASLLDPREIIVMYNPKELELVDACAFTKGNDKNNGLVDGTNVEITMVMAGAVFFMVHQDVPQSKMLSGTVNILRFKSLVSGSKTIEYEIDGDV